MSSDYKNAISAYDKSGKDGLHDPREVEARALMKSAQNMQNLKENWPPTPEELDEVLTKNRQLWSIFVASMEESTHIPFEIRSNIANLGIYTFKRTLDIFADPQAQKLDILINLNRNIAEGLIESVKNSKQATTQGNSQNTPPAPSSSTKPEETTNQTDLDLDI